MSKKKKIIKISCCLMIFCFICIIPIFNRVFLLRVKYNVDGNNVDCLKECEIRRDVYDGCESCWGYCINKPNEKIFLGIDFEGLSNFSLRDGCHLDGDFVYLFYDLEFPEKRIHPFWNETVYINFEKDDSGNIRGKITSDHHAHYQSDELHIQGDFPHPGKNNAIISINF